MRKLTTLCGAATTALIASGASAAVFTGWTVSPSLNSDFNEVWEIRANFDTAGLVFLSCFDYEDHGGTPMAAIHADSLTDPAGGVFGSWRPAYTTPTQNPFDSYVTAHGTFGSPTSGGTTLGPSFDDTLGDHLAFHSEWYDPSPGTPNTIAGTSYKVAQIVRAVGLGVHTSYLKLSFKIPGTTTVLFGSGEWSIGMPAPGALALLGLGSVFSRRRRA